MAAPSPPRYPLYVCENCGRLGPMEAFQEDCRPGWTHGRLRRVEQIRPEDVDAICKEVRS
jgi:hypothetical protein